MARTGTFWRVGATACILALALGLITASSASAEMPPTVLAINPGALQHPINPGVFLPAATRPFITNVYVRTVLFPPYSPPNVIWFDTYGAASTTAVWEVRPKGSPYLPAGFDGYDAAGYTVQHPIGMASDTGMTHHTLTLSHLTLLTQYNYFITATFPNGAMHTYFGVFLITPP